MEKIQRMLPCKLTQDEHIESAIILSEKLQELAGIEEEKKAANNIFKMKMDALETEIAILAENVKAGEEDREITCELVYNIPRRGMKSVVRLDTMETIEENDMTDADKRRAADQLQTRIPIPEENE